LGDAVVHMTELLDSLLDVNRLESGEISPEITDFSVAPVMARACEELAPVAASKGLQLRVVPCSSVIRSDRRLLARMLSNLLTNAVKYTDHGKVLVGCRHRGDTLRIEVWDNGIGIAADQLDAIFEEFYRVARSDTGRSGLGLGLYIVQRFAQLLDHTVEVWSAPGKGTMFALVVALADGAAERAVLERRVAEETSAPVILLVEDDPLQRDALRTLLELEGYRIMTAATGKEALAQLGEPTSVRPHVIVADYNLPGGMTGLDTIRKVRRAMGEQLPSVVISADRSSTVRRAIEADGLMSVSKPVRTAELVSAVEALASVARPGWQRIAWPRVSPAPVARARSEANVAVIDDESSVREALRKALEADGYKVVTFPSGQAFFADHERGRFRCLVVDVNLPGMNGLALQDRLKQERSGTPIIFVTGSGVLSSAVRAMREGAADFLQKPVRVDALRESVQRVLAGSEQAAGDRAQRDEAAARLGTLTGRERQVIEHMVAGQATKNIAAELRISERTVEHHRHSVMRKIGVTSLAMLVRLVAPHITEH
jgi:two-component system CheB/CheR fusion protein